MDTANRVIKGTKNIYQLRRDIPFHEWRIALTGRRSIQQNSIPPSQQPAENLHPNKAPIPTTIGSSTTSKQPPWTQKIPPKHKQNGGRRIYNNIPSRRWGSINSQRRNYHHLNQQTTVPQRVWKQHRQVVDGVSIKERRERERRRAKCIQLTIYTPIH